jgi:hypothetical protein
VRLSPPERRKHLRQHVAVAAQPPPTHRPEYQTNLPTQAFSRPSTVAKLNRRRVRGPSRGKPPRRWSRPWFDWRRIHAGRLHTNVCVGHECFGSCRRENGVFDLMCIDPIKEGKNGTQLVV